MIREIGIIGDFHNSRTQTAIGDSIHHVNHKFGYDTRYRWIETTLLDNDHYENILQSLHGIWSASGSPFKSLAGSLNAIRYARENRIPYLGTCGGYQHAIVEYARNVLGYKNAGHAEYSNEASEYFVDKMTCSLVGTKGTVAIKDGTLAKAIYGKNQIEADYYCSYGLSDKYKDEVLQGGITASGFDINESIRIMELSSHPFFIITAFVPQVNSTSDIPDPLVAAFVKKVNLKIS
jgi:CTP synthase (UTP-ammonia lyase)